MLLERIYDEDLAQASYLIGCQECAEAIVIDPRRDIAIYLSEAAANGMKITAVSETHIHADYLSGARELAAATGHRPVLAGSGSTWFVEGGHPDAGTVVHSWSEDRELT